MSDGFARDAGGPVGGDLVQVDVLGKVVEPDDGDDREGVAGDENSSSDEDKCVFLVADPIFVAQRLVLCFTQAVKVCAWCSYIERM